MSDKPEMTPDEIERAEIIGPPDFLLDPAEGPDALDELRALAAENTKALAAWPGESKGFEADLGEIEAGVNLLYEAADDELLGSLRSECVAALHRLRLRASLREQGE